MSLVGWSRPLGWLGRMLVLAGAYYVAGRLALLIAIPPGYATAVWPAAGVALVGLLWWGNRAWPGIVLGSFCINLPNSLETLAAVGSFKPFLLATALGAGAALQALVGTALVRRWVSPPALLEQETQVFKFMLLAGPLACLVSASLGVGSLWLAGAIAGAEVPFSWWTWWVGDSIGVLLVAPAFLTLTCPARQLPWRRKLQLSLPLTALCALVVLVFVHTSGLEQRRIHAEFSQRAAQLTRVLTLNLAGYSEVLNAVGDLLSSQPTVSRDQFAAFVERSLAERPGIQALSWNPRVLDAERAQFEAAARAEGYSDYQITGQDQTGRLQRAAQRPLYVPIRNIEPFPENARALGFDVASDPARLAALMRARDSGQSTATGSITLVQGGQRYGFLLARPVYDHGLPSQTIAQRRKNLRGYAVAAFRIDHLMASFLRGQDTTGMRIWLRDQGASAADPPLYLLVPPGGAPREPTSALAAAADVRTEAAVIQPIDGFSQSVPIELGGRRWTLQFALAPAYLHTQRSWLAWSVLAIGLLFTALLGAFLLVVAGRTGIIEETVIRRTSELRLANLGLERSLTELKDAEQRLIELAHFDPLTALPNRTSFSNALLDALTQAEKHGWTITVLFLDIDNFKNVNDTMGHACGDELLRQLGRRLVCALRARDTVGRLGGDEFAILLISTDNRHNAGAIVAEKLRAALRPPFDVEGREIAVTASIGMTVFPTDASDAEALIKYADTAMYAAKQAGRDTYRFYTAAMNASVVRRLALDNALRKALEREEFVLHYQPKIEIASGRWTGVEALLRWNRPGHGLVMPGEFISLLEETGLIAQVGTWVIDAACRQIGAWIADGLGPVPIAVNVSVQQLLPGRSEPNGVPGRRDDLGLAGTSSLEPAIERALREHHIDPRLLELELTESTLMLHAAGTVDLLQRLTSLGMQISIDDFGTGYSSLAYLKRFDVHTIKIDQTFIRDISTDVDDAAITTAIISMAHSLKLRVVAEGVETAEQLEFLRVHGCDEAQGYLLARPMAADACAAVLRGCMGAPA